MKDLFFHQIPGPHLDVRRRLLDPGPSPRHAPSPAHPWVPASTCSAVELDPGPRA
uniref:Uncharacterized protein n=1 Tax=Arundo donax TaxID=35708 RepID=A0A0A9B7S8_ARUDO